MKVTGNLWSSFLAYYTWSMVWIVLIAECQWKMKQWAKQIPFVRCLFEFNTKEGTNNIPRKVEGWDSNTGKKGLIIKPFSFFFFFLLPFHPFRFLLDCITDTQLSACRLCSKTSQQIRSKFKVTDVGALCIITLITGNSDSCCWWFIEILHLKHNHKNTFFSYSF